jgi:hypothetical protein
VSAGAVDALLVPAAPSLVPLACAFLHERVGAVDVALRLESCRWEGEAARGPREAIRRVWTTGVDEERGCGDPKKTS